MINIAVTGYYGTGSSAVIDLLREYKDVKCAIGKRFEHYPFLLKDCIFDLENRIFSPNSNYMIIDYALNAFYDEMRRQNDNNFGWYGSYSTLFKNKFMEIVNSFLDSISEVGDHQSFSFAKGIKFSLIKCGLQLGAKILKGRPVVKWGRVYTYRKINMRFLKVTHEEFINLAKNFINNYFDLCKESGASYMIYDHLLLPEQANMVDKFFDENFKLIIVDRDPRDIYILTNFIWSTVAFGLQKGPLPKDLDSFIRHWSDMHNRAKTKSKNVLYVQFEDLIYNYEETIKRIEKFCGLDPKSHELKGKILEPNKSINNTQVFKINNEYHDKIQVIEEKLGEYLYEFPYSINNNIKDIFDN